MRIILAVLVLATGVLAAPSPDFISPLGDYHEDYGIPQAARIKAAEEGMDFDGRITGGNFAQLGSFPWVGGLIVTMTTGWNSVCAASLLSHTRLVTAAHCWKWRRHQGLYFTVVLGSVRLFSGGVRIQTNQVVLHPDYELNNINNDIAMIQVSFVAYNAHINPISLPGGNDQYVGQRATAIGFGELAEDIPINQNQALSYVDLEVVSNEECVKYHSPLLIVDSTICTSGVGPRGPCPGDSGGPLVAEGPVLIGVYSFSSEGNCQNERPSAYARVTSFVPWIQSNL